MNDDEYEYYQLEDPAEVRVVRARYYSIKALKKSTESKYSVKSKFGTKTNSRVHDVRRENADDVQYKLHRLDVSLA